MAVDIHETAIVSPKAELGEDVFIGPYCTVEKDVRLGDRVRLQSHVVVGAYTSIGAETVAYPFAALGLAPQDKKFKFERSFLEIGARNTIREYVNCHRGTEGGGLYTRIGDENLLMVSVHVAHDVSIGDRCVLANMVTLAGHVEVGDDTIIGGLTGCHQFVKIGRGAMVGGMTRQEKDVLPFFCSMGTPARLLGLNVVGLRRRGFTHEAIEVLKEAGRIIFEPRRTVAAGVEIVEKEYGDKPYVREILDFIQNKSKRGLTLPEDRGD